jgi:hypothetical protein
MDKVPVGGKVTVSPALAAVRTSGKEGTFEITHRARHRTE